MDVKKEFFRLKEQWIHSTGKEREQADSEMQAFFDSLKPEDNALLEEAVNEDFARIHKDMEEAHKLAERIAVRRQIETILPFISVSALAKEYFGKSSSWFYQRLNGNTVHGKQVSFTENPCTERHGCQAEASGCYRGLRKKDKNEKSKNCY